MSKRRKIGIIGVGNVGAHVASSLVTQGICEEVVLIDCDQDKVKAHATDIADSLPYMLHDVQIYAGDYGDIVDADILVISASGSILAEDRLKELDITVEIMNEIIPKVQTSGFQGIVLSISNPCDLIAQYLHEKTGLRVIGTGTMLDTARLRMLLARTFQVSPSSVQGYVLGEHGDSQIVPWSLVTIGGIPIHEFEYKLTEKGTSLKELAEKTKHAGWAIVKGKGCTEFGIGAACAQLAKAVLQDEKVILPVSTYLTNVEVYNSVPCVIGRKGVERIIESTLTGDEKRGFQESCNLLKEHKKRLDLVIK